MSNAQNPAFDSTRRQATYARFARYGTVALLMLLFIATHTPGNAIPHSVLSADKLAHCLAYFMLAFATLTSWDLAIGKLRPQHYFTVWLVGTLYGAFDEITQIPVGRHCDIFDWMCDILGIVLALTFFRLLRPVIYRILNFKPVVD